MSFILLVIVLACSGSYSRAQFCGGGTLHGDLTGTMTTSFSTVTGTGGTYAYWTFTATAGVTYTFSTCGLISSDTYLRLYSGTNPSTATFVTGSDDDCSAQSYITWTCPSSGDYSIHLSQYSCNALYGNTDMQYMSDAVLPACSGTPTAGTTTSSANPVCSGISFTLSISGGTSGFSGLTYQWQSSTDGITYANISGATSSTLATNQTSATYYQRIITCSASGISTTSAPLFVTMSAPSACYCTPSASTYPCVYDWISNVTTAGGITNFNNTTGCAGTSYTNYSGSISASQLQGSVVNMSFTAAGYSLYFSVFIDYNDDGDFADAGETVINNFAVGPFATGGTFTDNTNFTVDPAAPAGTHRMRVRGDYYYTITGPCTMLYEGETEDYAFTVIAAVACSGTPTPGNTVSSANPVCALANFTLSMSTPPASIGNTFQWQSSSDGVTYANISGATSSTYTTSQTASTYYQVVVTCTASGISAPSTPLNVTMSAPASCYCTPPPASNACFYMYTSNVTSSGDISDFNNSSSCAPTSYTNFSASAIATQNANSTVNLSMTSSGYAMNYTVWVDYNDNGSFADAGEQVLVIYNGSGFYSVSGSFTIPLATSGGTHRMRVMGDYYGTAQPSDPCGTLVYGETEDYGLTVIPSTPCSGTPTSGTTTSSANPVCSGIAFSLGTTGGTLEAGLTYQWQSSSDGITYANISGATGLTYATSQTAATYYQLVVTCTASGISAPSTPLFVTMSSPSACYCTPICNGDCSQQIITAFSITGTTLSNSSACPGGIKYTQYPASGSTTGDVLPGSTYTFNVSSGSNGNPAQAGIWIDYDHSGTFDASEFTLISSSFPSPGSTSVPITISMSALTGSTGLRVRSNWVGSPAIGAGDACSTLDYGETEDYTVNIINPAATTVSSFSPSEGCQNITPVTINGFNFTGATGVSFGGTPALSYTVLSDNQIIATPGTGTTGTISVTSPAGTGTSAATFTVNTPPAIYNVTGGPACSDPGATVGLDGSDAGVSYQLYLDGTPTGITASGTGSAISFGTQTAAGTYTVSTLASASLPSGYCDPVMYPSNPCNYLNSVTTTGGITNITSAVDAGYNGTGSTFFSGASVSEAIGGTFTVTCQAQGFCDIAYYTIWVDWNHNGVFEASEKMVSADGVNSGNTITNFNITVPASAIPGSTRMRITADGNSVNPTTACDNLSSNYSENEDYVVTVTGGSPCTAAMNGNALVTAGPVVNVTPANPVVCLAGTPASATLTASGADTYTWGPGGETGAVQTFSPSATTTYSVTGTSTGTGCSTTQSVTVTASPGVNITTSATPANICSGGSSQLDAVIPGSGSGSTVSVYPFATSGSSSPLTLSAPATLLGTGLDDNTSSETAIGFSFMYEGVAKTTFGVSSNGAFGLDGSVTSAFSNATPSYSTLVMPYWEDQTTGTDGGVFYELQGTAPNRKLVVEYHLAIYPSFAAYTQTYQVILSETSNTIEFRYGSGGGTGSATVGITGAVSTDLNEVNTSTHTNGTSSYDINTSWPGSGRSYTFSPPVDYTYSWTPAGTLSDATIHDPVASPTGTTTYTITASDVTTGCSNNATVDVNVNPDGTWVGISSDWTDGGNWCGGVPTASSNVIIPSTGTTPFDPHIFSGNTGDVHNINLQGSSVTVDNGGTMNLFGDVILSPSGTFDATGGTVNFAGSSTQNILPGFTTANLAVNGGSNKNLTGNVTVTTNLNLASGHVVLNSNDLIMAPGATITGGSPSSYVMTSDVGSELVQEVNTGTGAVMFPVGNLTYNPATLTNTGASDNFRIHVRDQVLDGGTSGSQVNAASTYVINHTWDIEEDVIGGSNSCVTLQWGAGEENNPLFEYPHVYVSHYYAGSWHHDGYGYATDAPPAIGYPGAGPYTSTLCSIGSFSPFAIGSSGGVTPLPVHLTDVSATNEGPKNRIEWHSAAEAGLDHYEVERSTDGNNFSHMTDVAAAGHAFGYLTYDNQPNAGLTYYRIKMVEQGSLSSFSQVVYAFMKVGDNETVTVFPNPVTDVLHVEVFGATDKASVILTDLSGKVISPLSLNNGKAEISTANLASGVYFVKFTDGSVNQTIKVNKQ